MNKYTIYCTQEQTKKALELGAPIEQKKFQYHYRGVLCEKDELIIPTAEQIIGWLEEQIDSIDLIKHNNGTWIYLFYPTNAPRYESKNNYSSRKEATLAAIDAALLYMTNNKNSI